MASRAADFYDGIEVGDRFDYRPNGLSCSFRFEVTGIGETTVPRSFLIEPLGGFASDCRGYPATLVQVTFVWGVPRDFPRLTQSPRCVGCGEVTPPARVPISSSQDTRT